MSAAGERTSLKIEVSCPFEMGHAEAALTRFRYLRPDVKAGLEAGQVQLADVLVEEATSVEAEFRYLMYRERIYTETLPMRQRIYARLFG